MPEDLSHRRSLLTIALVGALLPADVPEGRMMRAGQVRRSSWGTLKTGG
jgi:hypothetical protein